MVKAAIWKYGKMHVYVNRAHRVIIDYFVQICKEIEGKNKEKNSSYNPLSIIAQTFKIAIKLQLLPCKIVRVSSEWRRMNIFLCLDHVYACIYTMDDMMIVYMVARRPGITQSLTQNHQKIKKNTTTAPPNNNIKI